MKKHIPQLFWIYVISVILQSVLPIGGNFDKIKIGLGPVALRMDYFLHACMFLFFFLIYIVAVWFNAPLFKLNARRNLFLLTFSLAIITECLQLLTPYRSFYLLDMVSNMAGVGIGMIVSIRASTG